jgi:phosphoribosylcarboxyaminoimidazole (NCAIR) mutase
MIAHALKRTPVMFFHGAPPAAVAIGLAVAAGLLLIALVALSDQHAAVSVAATR